MGSESVDRGVEGTVGVTPIQANFVLGMVTFAYAMAYVDRQLLNLLVEPIKQSLAINDTQFSFIQGTAFVVSYLAAAPVFGRLVDVASRRAILIFGVASWSVFTALSGFCSTFTELFVARLGVGVTEACIFPVAWSLIGDCFSPKRLPGAMSVFFLGPQLGGGFSLIAGGLIVASAASLTFGVPMLTALEPWQMAFVVVGVPGVLFALLLLAMVEPPRTRNPLAMGEERRLGFVESLTALRRHGQLYSRVYAANAMVAIVQLAGPTWLPAFMMRVHGLSATQTGLTLGIVSAVVAPIGALCGPVASAWLQRRGYIDAPLRAAAWCSVPMFLFSFLIPVVPSATAALVVAAGVIFCCSFPVGLMSGSLQMATSSQLRGIVAAIYTFVAQLIGYMVGPTLIAVLTDRYFQDPKMVGHSMQIVMSVAALFAGFFLFGVLPHFRTIVAKATADDKAG